MEQVYGGDLVYAAVIPGGGNWGGLGTPWSITNFWEKYFNHDSSTVNRRRY
ncbi:peptide pheromone VP1 [Streptococcus australis]|nr:peptide pheromone VP1 [Streptococcus australis]